MIPALIYVLCTLTSTACAALLLRSYARSRLRLLLWTGIGFSAVALNNVLLFLDLIVFTEVDLSGLRDATALLAVALFLYGLIWDSQ